MRCPTCNKFVSFADDPHVEIESVDVNNNHVEVNATLQLECAECGETLRQAELVVDASLDNEDHTCSEYREFDAEQDDESYDKDDLFVSSDEGLPEPIVRRVNGRDHYGFKLETYIRCKCCGEDFTKELSDITSSSNFEDAV